MEKIIKTIFYKRPECAKCSHIDEVVKTSRKAAADRKKREEGENPQLDLGSPEIMVGCGPGTKGFRIDGSYCYTANTREYYGGTAGGKNVPLKECPASKEFLG